MEDVKFAVVVEGQLVAPVMHVMELAVVIIVIDRVITDMKKDIKFLYIFILIIISSVLFFIRSGKAWDVFVYDSNNSEIMKGYHKNGEIQMEGNGYPVSGSIDNDGHIFMYNYKTGCYMDGDVDEYGNGRVYDYATGEYYDITIE